MHGEEQRECGTDCLFATATQAAVLNFTSKQFSNDRLTGRTQRTAEVALKQTKIDIITFPLNCLCKAFVSERRADVHEHQHLFQMVDLTCCWLPCRPVDPLAPVSPGEAE